MPHGAPTILPVAIINYEIVMSILSIYRVKHDYDNGIWIKDHPNPVVEVRAANPDEAVKQVFGKQLSRKGRLGQYCAQVWPLGGVQRAKEITHFYSA
jgi:hypothetical protein